MGGGTGGSGGKPARLPKSAPDALKQFVACKVMSVELDLAEVGWIPGMPGMEALEPTARVLPGSTATSGTIRIEWGPGGYVAVELPASIVDGELRIDTSDTNPVVAGAIDDWVGDFNATLERNGKRLKSFALAGNKITLTKETPPPPEKPEEKAPGGVTTPPPVITPGTGGSEPPKEPPEDKAANDGCREMMGSWIGIIFIVFLIVVAAIVIAFLLVSRDGDDDVTVTADPEPAASEQPTEAPTGVPTEAPTEVPSEVPTEEPELVFDFDFGGYTDPIPTEAIVWDVATEESLGQTTLPGQPTISLMFGQSGPDGTPTLFYVEPLGVAPESGAIEVFGFTPDGDIGFTSSWGPAFPNFGRNEQSDLVVECEGGWFGGGVFPGDLQDAESLGYNLYAPTDSTPGGEGFPPGSTISTGRILLDEPAPGRIFAPNPPSLELRAEAQGGTFEGFSLDCPRGQDRLREIQQELIQAQMADAGIDIDIDEGAFAEYFGEIPPPPGEVVFVSPDGAGDVVEIESGEPIGSAPGADLDGLIGAIDDEQLRVVVSTVEPPTETELGFSSAWRLNVLFRSGAATSLIREIHDEQPRIGFELGDGTIDSTGTDITIDDDAVRFNFFFDPNDPPTAIQVQSFNTPDEGDPLGSDTTFAAADPFPVAPTTVDGSCGGEGPIACLNNERFSVEVVGPGGVLLDVNQMAPDTAVFTDGDGSIRVRVLNGCPFIDNFWVDTLSTPGMEGEVIVEDTATGQALGDPILINPANPAITDTQAFATCP